MNTSTALPAVRWGTQVETGTVNSHPCRMYAERPRAMGELLLDAGRWTEREFMVQGDRRVTGRQHAVSVARVAAHLRRLGLQSGDPVLLLGFNQIEWLTSFWALQCCGAMVALGNAWWSEQELDDAAALVKPRFVLMASQIQPPQYEGATYLSFDDIRSIAESGIDEPLVLDAVDEEAPAVVIFSSGTTGKAKGLVMSHRGVIANIQNLMVMTGRLPSELAPSHPGTVSLVTMPLFHLGGFQISIMTLLSGGKVVFLKRKFESLEVLELMQQERVRAWGSVPTMVARVVQHERFAEFDTSSVSSVQMGGAPIPHELREQVGKAFPASRKRVGAMYGLTEVGGVLATGSGDDVQGRPGCVGRPLSTVEIRLANADASGTGEIMARTPTATCGYLGDPTRLDDADGWIASGDLGRFDDEGRLYITGRAKDMIIRGGENVASVRVERCLRTHPAVAEVAVVGLPHSDLGEEVAAAVVIRPGSSVTADELKAHAASQLARFEVPSRWWLRQEPLPTNPTGKVLKREVTAAWPAEEVLA
ncbi:MAG: class I adenylate-forming enzyme family protein [Ottowia sp.]|uniref:class I adenylate-forming enzyme family protein n=1 Tax=Ottowia sp. TaxID=1898956 RepID=UPI003C7582B8